MAPLPQRSALIAGSTGVVGRQLLSMLLNEPRYREVHALLRRPIDNQTDKLATHIIDFDQLSQHAALLKVEDVFCCLGTTLKQAGSRAAFERVDHDYVVQLARLAQQAGAKRFLMISAVGASPSAMAFYSRVKGRTEADVLSAGPATIHILRPSLLMGEREENRPGEALAQRLMPTLNPLLAGPLKKYRGIAASEVARKMLELALHGPDGRQVHHFD